MKTYRLRIFPVICGFITMIAVVLVGSNIVVIAFRGFESLPECFFRKETLLAIRLSVKSACISTILCFLIAIPTAYTLTRSRIPCRWLIEIMLELTMSLPYIVIGLSLLILFSSPGGKWLKTIGFPVVFSKNGIIVAQLVVNMPFAINLVSAAFRTVDIKFERVAGLLGATPFKQFYTILLPLCRKTLISAVILVWSRALGEFGATLMLVGVTRMKTETLPASIYLDVSTNDLGGALSSAFILLSISAVSLGLANAFSRKKKNQNRYE